MKKVLVTGSTGLLGRNLCPHLHKTFQLTTPKRSIFDVTKKEQVQSWLSKDTYDAIVHLAAYTNVAKAEIESYECYVTNILGTLNLVNAIDEKTKLIFLSTDYVFSGDEGNYTERNKPNPINFYGMTKYVAEEFVGLHKEHLIIRTSFKNSTFPYEIAFTDLVSTADYVDVIAQMIAKLITKYIEGSVPGGIVHVGTKKQSIYDLIKMRNPKIKPGLRSLASIVLPRDVSLNTNKYKRLMSNTK